MIPMEDKAFNKYESSLIKFLQSIKLAANTQVFLFGSRARRDHSERSDLDIAFLNLPKTISLANLEEQIDQLNIPYHVDLVDLASVSQEFYNKCMGEAINIQDVQT